jgi:hypothetical protein
MSYWSMLVSGGSGKFLRFTDLRYTDFSWNLRVPPSVSDR